MKEDRLKSIEKMLDKNKSDSFLNYAAALEYHKFGNIQKAISLLSDLIKNDPNYLGTYFQLGRFYEEIGKTKEAIAVYRSGTLVAKSQNDNKTLGELSEALMLLDDDFMG